jgi:hypothetical protein
VLSAQVWLTDMAHFADHNAVWNAWLDPKNPPVRACVQAPQLWRQGMLVEIIGDRSTVAAAHDTRAPDRVRELRDDAATRSP